MSAAPKAQVNTPKSPLKENAQMSKFGKRHGNGARALLVLMAAIALLAAMAAAAQAAAPALTLRTDFADTADAGVSREIEIEEGVTLQFGHRVKIGLFIENSGNAPMSGTLSASVTLPAGLKPFFAVTPGGSGPVEGACNVVAQLASCEIEGAAMQPSSQEQMFVFCEIEPNASGELTTAVEVSAAA